MPIEGVTPTVIAKTSAESWTYAGTDLDPPAPGTELKSYPVVVVARNVVGAVGYGVGAVMKALGRV